MIAAYLCTEAPRVPPACRLCHARRNRIPLTASRPEHPCTPCEHSHPQDVRDRTEAGGKQPMGVASNRTFSAEPNARRADVGMLSGPSLYVDSPHTMNATIARRHGPGRTLVRRWFVMFCVALFVFANLGHAVACTEASVSVIVSDGAFSSPDEDAGPSKQAVSGENHCHGCTAISTPVMIAAISPIITSAEVALTPEYRVDAGQCPSDPPPPKSLD